MKKLSFYLLIFVSLLVSCGAPKQVINYSQLAENAYQSGEYQQSINQWQQYIENQESNSLEINPKAYAEMAKAYFQLEQYEKAEQYFDRARNKNYADEEMYVMMSERYRMIDNLSKELTALEYYRDHFAGGTDSVQMRNRLFETYIESENWKPAQATWQKMDEESQQSEVYLQMYFEMNKELEQNGKCDEISLQLLAINAQNKDALDWQARKYYNLAENRYQSAMAAYNKKKTTKNYKILLKELDLVTSDFKEALKYFEPLWEMEDGKKYASYLANIYVRFDDKKKADYYKSFIK
jgi:tetratricopeptide (TPR) repeat protein